MSDERTTAPDTGQDLDFERADFGGAAAGSGAGSMSCSICEMPIADAYYTANAAFVCPRCEGPARTAGPPGSSVGRLFAAVALGAIAAIIASALWMVVTELTGYEIGLIAIAVGFIVGVAVQIGNRGVGGLPYQLLAIFLTYTAIVMTYVPTLAAELEPGLTGTAAEQIQDPSLDLGLEPGPGETESGDVTAARIGDDSDAPDEIVLSPEAARLTAWVISIPLAYAVPFLAGFENAIGILIIGFALYQAWKMTAKTSIEWAGPFQVGDQFEG